MEQILGLVVTILITAGAAWGEKKWKAYKRKRRYRYEPVRRYSAPAAPPPVARTHEPSVPVIMSPEDEGGSIIQIKPVPVETPPVPAVPSIPDAVAPESPEISEHYRRWRQAIIDAEVLAPRSF